MDEGRGSTVRVVSSHVIYQRDDVQPLKRLKTAVQECLEAASVGQVCFSTARDLL